MKLTGLLIFFLFMLNILLILAIILLYLRQNRFIEIEGKQRKIQEESEEILTAFILEIKEENEQFIEKINKMQQTINSLQLKEQKPSQSEENSHFPISDKQNDQQDRSLTPKAYSRLLASQTYKNDVYQVRENEKIDEDQLEIHTEKQVEEKTMIQHVSDLNKQGLSSGEIAKVLKKGRTEIELLLKFHENRK